jgi:hypothetical protein
MVVALKEQSCSVSAIALFDVFFAMICSLRSYISKDTFI